MGFSKQEYLGFPDSSAGKESACDAGDPGSTPGSGRSAGEGNSYPLQYSGLENSMDCIVYGVAKSQTRLSNFHFYNSDANPSCFMQVLTHLILPSISRCISSITPVLRWENKSTESLDDLPKIPQLVRGRTRIWNPWPYSSFLFSTAPLLIWQCIASILSIR